MVECVENYFQDERLQMAYLGQGVIGTNASPHDRGTASIHFHHQSGRLGGSPGMWGYVKGGMGMVSFILCDIARDLGAVGAHRRPRGPDHPRRGRRARGGRADRARVTSSPTPTRARRLKLLGDAGRPRLEGQGRADPPGRLHRQAQRGPQGAAQLHGPARHQRWTITRARSTRRSPRTSGRRRSKRPARANSPLASGPSSTSRPPTTRPSRPRACTR